MGQLYREYCYPDLDSAATAALSNGMFPNGFVGDSYSLDAANDQFALLDTIAPTDNLILQAPDCSTLGYKPWVVAPVADIQLLWGAAALVIFAAWGFKMAKLALKG